MSTIVNFWKVYWNKECPVHHEKNLCEKAGDALTWHVNGLSHKVWAFCKDPRVVTVALTALAMLAVSFAFYPATTALYASKAITLIAPYFKSWAVKLAIFIATQVYLFGLGVRAIGRFSDATVKTRWNRG